MDNKDRHIKVPKIVDFFIKTAYDNKYEAIGDLIKMSSGDDDFIYSGYSDWLEDSDNLTGLTDKGKSDVAKWSEDTPMKDLLNLINGYEVEEDE